MYYSFWYLHQFQLFHLHCFSFYPYRCFRLLILITCALISFYCNDVNDEISLLTSSMMSSWGWSGCPRSVLFLFSSLPVPANQSVRYSNADILKDRFKLFKAKTGSDQKQHLSLWTSTVSQVLQSYWCSYKINLYVKPFKNANKKKIHTCNSVANCAKLNWTQWLHERR